MKFIQFFCICAVIFFAMVALRADEKHHHTRTNTNYQSTTNNYQISSKGVASAIAASQHQYYWGKSGLQGSAAMGVFDNKTAFSFGLAKKYKKTLINGSVSNEGGKIGAGVGINWIF